MPPIRSTSVLQSTLTFFQISHPQEYKKVIENITVDPINALCW